MDCYNSNANEEANLLDLSGYPQPNINSNYASVYQIKYNSELVFVYVRFQGTHPSFDNFVTAIKLQCEISDDYTIEISNEKECKIPNDIVFAHFIRYVYNENCVFIVKTQKTIETSAQEVIQTIDKIPDLPLIYENPDKFFIYFLSKDLINYFKYQTEIICTPTGTQLIEKYNALKDPHLEDPHKKSIIQISANHLMLIKNNEPSTQDRTLWAKVICEVFVQFRDTDCGSNNYLAVYNPVKGDGFLGNRIKLLKKAAKRIKTNKQIIEQLNTNPTESEQNTVQSVDINQSEIQELVDFMKTCDISKDLSVIIDYHTLFSHTSQSSVK